MNLSFKTSRVLYANKCASTLFPNKATTPKCILPNYKTSQLSNHQLPAIKNEVMRDYPANSVDRNKLMEALDSIQSQAPFHVNLVINGKEVSGEGTETQVCPSDHKNLLCTFENASKQQVEEAIEGALQAREKWSQMPIYDRQAIFLKAADLITNKYRYIVLASTMLGQGKNIWQAEIDSTAEASDFLRFNAKYSSEIYSTQPTENSNGTWNHLEYRPLEGFVYAVSPFNFTAIGVNLAAAPAIMGNTVLWKPSNSAILSNYIMYKILEEAGLPEGVIQFIPGDPIKITDQIVSNPNFAALHFTGSTSVFKNLWKKISSNIDVYKSYPRIVGETGGKNFHLLHSSANVDNAVLQTIRGAFEYQGQKCSATSRIYVPDNLWPEFKSKLLNIASSIKMGNVTDPETFVGPVINKVAFDKIKSYIDFAKSSSECEVIMGGNCDSSVGYFVEPTVIETTDPNFKTMTEEIFGPVLTAYVYKAEEFKEVIDIIDNTSNYALTGSIFSQDREAILYASSKLVNAAGNFYINDKSTGAVVGQQPFGGARASGTNDKAGSANLLTRFVSPRSIKETFLPIENYKYPSNLL
ncbi:Delta-1-pyrroline-5-carboxylate dehydrogenase, mitochondrial [Smittium culicis]|uniref:Multifunctional fusion protein n=1 Tax=Smittium culicis TaxID=133412 RepID=A0A1R1WYM2_9FUNG|nr:Delta-1-pyrroline-5-carboxylate dehydrogenase, mitochondrial [Smittium culicis]